MYLLKPFQRRSALHAFIEFVVRVYYDEEVRDVDLYERRSLMSHFSGTPGAVDDLKPTLLPVEEALGRYGLAHESFDSWMRDAGINFCEATEDDVAEYYGELWLGGPLEALTERIVQEVFFILFQNRQLLLTFNEMLAVSVAETEPNVLEAEHRALFASPGRLRRATIPVWAQRAVYFRDRGLCNACKRDLSGTLSLVGVEHYDHIVPLARGGLNDVTNMQLLCAQCNLAKRANEPSTSNVYEAWYNIDDAD